MIEVSDRPFAYFSDDRTGEPNLVRRQINCPAWEDTTLTARVTLVGERISPRNADDDANLRLRLGDDDIARFEFFPERHGVYAPATATVFAARMNLQHFCAKLRSAPQLATNARPSLNSANGICLNFCGFE
ncbi:MAG TPA: hypothetical protein VH206_14965 [Xanthobacteraceae bacterium]|nr:hypothetical protein [Xanthobacteraceae bacterium]